MSVEDMVDRILARADERLEQLLLEAGFTSEDRHAVPRKIHAPLARRAMVTAIVEALAATRPKETR